MLFNQQPAIYLTGFKRFCLLIRLQCQQANKRDGDSTVNRLQLLARISCQIDEPSFDL